MFVSAGEIICLVALLASPRPESHTSSACLRGSLANVSIRARVEEILAAGAERAEITVEQVLRELAVLGFSGIGKVVRWRPELVLEETADEENPDKPVTRVLSEPRPGDRQRGVPLKTARRRVEQLAVSLKIGSE
jgi:hypothetical protein